MGVGGDSSPRTAEVRLGPTQWYILVMKGLAGHDIRPPVALPELLPIHRQLILHLVAAQLRVESDGAHDALPPGEKR